MRLDRQFAAHALLVFALDGTVAYPVTYRQGGCFPAVSVLLSFVTTRLLL